MEAVARRVMAERDAEPARRLVGVHGAAIVLGCTERAIRNKVAAGVLTPVRIDRRLRFDLRDLDVLIEDNKQ